MRFDRSNYEIWLIEWLDGTLIGEQAEKFRIFLDKNPHLKEEAEFISQSRLSPGNQSFPGKNHLKKTAGDLSPSLIEFLSIAYLENDLSNDQLNDLKEKYPDILTEIRQKGLFIGLKMSDIGYGPVMSIAGYNHGIFAVYADNDHSVLQFLPPLIIDDDNITYIIERLDAAVKWAKDNPRYLGNVYAPAYLRRPKA